MDKLKIAVLFGGISEEHDVSIKSAQQIAGSLDSNKYQTYFIGITKDGLWKQCQKPAPFWDDDSCVPAIISPDRRDHGLLLFRNGRYERVHIDVVFPVIHGKMGEDGQIQGLLALSGIPYVGCDLQSSVLGMDKSLTHLVAEAAGISTPKFMVLHKDDQILADRLSYPVFVKPARSGSSFGVNKVTKASKLAEAVHTARLYDNKVLIEEAITGSEVGCSVLGAGDELIVGEVDMITLTHGFFRIHQEDKPEDGSENATVIVPAPIPHEVSEQIKETAKKVYKALECTGLARVDMFLQDNGKILLNEVNTMPGCTSYSRYPRMMAAAGIPLAEMIDRAVDLALRR